MKQNLKQSLERLYALRTFGIKPGLDVTVSLLNRLGNPHHAFAAIHVAGTNGKGSVCAMLESVLRQAGLRVGLYTSPHLINFNERIQVNGEAINDEELAALFEDMEAHAAAVSVAEREVTFFEFTTALAFEYFRRKGVQVAVVETGMGGRLDSTNVVMPLVSVITRIGLDHTAYLGTTLAAIAGEKAGIIKDGRPVICGATPDEAKTVIRATAGAKKSRLVEVEDAVAVRRVSQNLMGQKVAITSGDIDYGTVPIKLLGKHQLENVATVVATLEVLADCSPLKIPIEVIRAGLAAAKWLGRLQVLVQDPPTILDGAHNPDGARALAVTLKDLLKKKKVGLIWGMCDDKDALGFAKAMGATVKRCWIVPINSERNADPRKLLQIAKTEGWETMTSPLPEAMELAKKWAQENEGAVCIAGSLFLAGEVLSYEKY
ncbi:MAG: folylpolyglutamate synthase/dihydrofolate synthase family protein [bacterium]|jgi:dihydrofolate synthase/folylpolyglutamate synthase